MKIILQTRQEIFNDGYKQGYMQGLQAGKEDPDLHLQKNRISLTEFANLIGVKNPAVFTAQKYQRYIYIDNLGRRYATLSSVKQYLQDEKNAKYLLEQIRLFVEWLHDVKGISSSEIARRVGASPEAITKLAFGVEVAIAIGKAYREKLDEFDNDC